MMPQKKNPDVSELVRGKTGRVVGHLMAMLTAVKGLPLAYNKDLQEDKEGIFDAIDTVKFSLSVYSRLIRGMKVRRDVMRRAVEEDFSNATDLADYLVKKGMPFRQAHAVAGKAVHDCIEKGIWLKDMSLDDYKQLSPLFDEDIQEAIRPETCVRNRDSFGGTSYHQTELQLKAGRAGDVVGLGGIRIEEIPYDPEVKFPVRKRASGDGNIEAPEGEWNKAEIVCRGGKVSIRINGSLENEVTVPYTDGYIAIQSEGGPLQFRNITLKEL